jgi:Manganese-stabilising protein / photosystem II polypeptide.
VQDAHRHFQINAELGEVGGVFVQQQPSDTDLGSKTPKQVSMVGNALARVAGLDLLNPPESMTIRVGFSKVIS